MRLLDLFCGAGGAAMGYHRAGFDEIVGVDNRPQKRYPFTFVLGDALEYVAEHGREFDMIHASPPCQRYSVTRSIHGNGDSHPDFVAATRMALQETGKPWVIENVPGAPLINPLILCGTMFPELRVYRHRLFESSPPVYFAPGQCSHTFTMPPRGMYHTLDKYEYITCVAHNFQAESGRIAMAIDWMTRDELAQAIPPAYTEYIGGQMLRHMEAIT